MSGASAKAERRAKIRADMRWYINQIAESRKALDAPVPEGLTYQQHRDERDRKVWEFVGATQFFYERIGGLLTELDGLK